MSIVMLTDGLVAWATKEVCSKIKLKLPDNQQMDASYNQNYKLVNPSVFFNAIPTKDRLTKEDEQPIPSLCIQILDGENTLNTGKIRIRLSFAVWNPGTHGKDMRKADPEFPLNQQPWQGDEADAYYQRNFEGWRDIWNFLDIAMNALEGSETIAKYRILHENGIQYGSYSEHDVVIDFYPCWYAWLTFTLEYGVTRHKQVTEFL